jgi:hypothetical protein
MDKPQFQHDCDHCVFLGRFVDEEQDPPEHSDLYADHEGGRGTVVVRRGNEGSDYTSGLEFTRLPAIREATRRAVVLAVGLYHQHHVVWTKTPPATDGTYWTTGGSVAGHLKVRLVDVHYSGGVGEVDVFGDECSQPLDRFLWWSTTPIVLPEGPEVT